FTPDLLSRRDWQASTTLARIAERRGDVSSARQHYEQALELDPTWKSALFGLGSLLATGGDRSRSRALLAEFERLEAAEDELSVAATAAQAKPDDPEAQLALARALRKAGQPRLAADRYARYLGMRADPAAEAEYVDVICELATPEPSGPQASERP
ncbi:MAG: tetratricopeptide repeat protein, partial [Armatimonadota bacterium]